MSRLAVMYRCALRSSLTCALTLLVVLAHTSASGLDRDRTIAQFHHTAWTVADGAPADVWALAQAPDGYLWLGTGTGLYRFDGVRFERIQPAAGEQFTSTNITALTALPSGELWIGYYFGGASLLLRDGRLVHYTERDGMPLGTVFRFARDDDGTLWVATSGGLARFEGQRWQTIGPEWGFPGSRADWVFVDRDGTLWVATRETLAFLRRGSRAFESTGEPIGQSVLAQAADGRLWMSDEVRGTRALPGLHKKSLKQAAAIGAARAATVQSKRLLFDRDGALWASDAIRGGIYRVPFPERLADQEMLRPGDVTDRFTQDEGLTANIAVPLLEDREGNIWVGTNLGLNRFRHNNVVVATSIPATSPSGFALAPGDQGAVFVANPGSLVSIGRQSPQVIAESLPEISCAYRGADGVLWLGGPDGLRHLAGNRLVRTALPEEAGNADVQAITADGSGALWVSIDRKGVFRLENGTWTHLGSRPNLPKLTANAAATDASGRIWFGYPDNKVILLDGDNVRTFSSNDGLHTGHVMTISASERHLWIGGELGLARLDGNRFRTLSAARLEAMSGISGIIETPEGELWLNGSLGIVRVSLAELQRALEDSSYRPRYEIFDFRDGLPGIAQQVIPVPTAIAASGGRLWFATNHGVVWIEPARIVRNRIPPPVSIRSLNAAGKLYAPSAPVQLPKRTSNVRIDYTALSLSIPERVRFRYKLAGADDQWRDAGTRREAFYTNLDPGNYRFQVVAANNDGVWNETGATLDFSIAPAFVQTKWFLGLCAVASAAVLWMLYLLRLRQMATRIRGRLKERLVERERIARELHDTLLQGFQGLILRFQAATERIPETEPARQLMEQALDRADQVLIEGRDRVKDLRTPMEAASDLPQAFADAGAELTQGHAAQFRVVVEGTSRQLHPIVYEEAWRIGREALFNAFHHAQARQIEVEITYDRRVLHLRFRDDGCGIDAQILGAGGRDGHWGLAGMRERAQKIRARLDIWSRPGAGTEIELQIPGALAYANDRAVARWSWLRRIMSTE